MSTASILARLFRLEARLAPPPVDDGALERVMAELDRMAERMRAQDWPEPTPEQIAALLAEFGTSMATL